MSLKIAMHAHVKETISTFRFFFRCSDFLICQIDIEIHWFYGYWKSASEHPGNETDVF